MSVPIKAGFPNPAGEARDIALDLNELIIRHPVSTYYLRVEGAAMLEAGINPGDIVVVDRSLDPKSGDTVAAVANGDFMVRHLRCEGGKAWLSAAAGEAPLALHETPDAQLWGVVTHVIHALRI